MTHKTLIAALLLSLPLLAGEGEKSPQGDGRAAIAERDADGDGRLSLTEFGGGQRIFELLDRNGDGFLQAEELPRARRKKGAGRGDPEKARAEAAAKFLKRHDGDADGKISAEEFPQGGRMKFDMADKNGDGFVDAAELGQLFQRGARDAKGDRAKRRGPDAAQIRKQVQNTMKRLDKNGDGKLSGDEIPQGGRFDLTKADKNKDGAVDLFELTESMQARMRRPGNAGGEQLARRLKQLDTNGDGVIEKSEWQGPEQFFARLDADKDGKISAKEMKRAARGGRWSNRAGEALFRRADRDKDGKITAEEWPMRKELFTRFDANGDGVITRDEVTPKGPRGRRARIDLKSGKDSASFLAGYDKNRDGQVTKEEFPHERRFAEIDTDSNGVLSKTEIEEAMDKRSREDGYGFFERFDLDGDGKVTRAEFTGPAAAFERFDKNHDGIVDKTDLPDK